MALQWKRDMRQGVVTCLCEVGLGCGAFPWIGGAQQEKQMVFGLEGLCYSTHTLLILKAGDVESTRHHHRHHQGNSPDYTHR